jgi:hypothetical protein
VNKVLNVVANIALWIQMLAVILLNLKKISTTLITAVMIKVFILFLIPLE